MERLTRWLREQFALNPSKTQAELADRLGIDKSGVSRILRGQRMVKAHEVGAIADYFGVMPPLGLSEDQAEFVAGPTALAPIYRMATEVRTGWRLYRNEPPVDRRTRTTVIARDSLAFGVYAPDDYAAPRFKPGEIIWADPGRPPRLGDDVLILESRLRGGQRAEIGELVGQSARELRIARHRDGEVRAMSARQWSAVFLPGRT